MNRTFALLLLFLALPALPSCRNAAEQRMSTPRVFSCWVKTYHSVGKGDEFHSISRTAEGGYIVAGKARIQDLLLNFRYEAGILKLDDGGNIQWQYGFGGKPWDLIEFQSARQTNDGGYLAMGKINWQGLLVKLDAGGAMRWQQVYQGHLFQSFSPLTDGDFVVTGSSVVAGPERSLLIARLGPDGRSRWQKVYGPGEGRAIVQTRDGSLTAIAYQEKNRRPESRVLRLDPAGGVQWERRYQGRLNALEPLADGGVLLAGTVDTGALGDQGWMLRCDRDGNELWRKTFGGAGADEFRTIKAAGEGTFVVLGNTRSFGSENGDLWALKIDENGNVLWQEAIGGPKLELAEDAATSSDGGCVLAGRTVSFTRVSEVPLLLKLDAQGNMPERPSALFHSTDAIPEPKEGGRIADDHQPDMQAARDVSVVPAGAAFVPDSLSLVAASFLPPEPKLLVSPADFKRGPYAKKTSYRHFVYLWNVGAVNLAVRKARIEQEAPPEHKFRYYLNRIWEFVTVAKVYTLESVCPEVEPDSYCTATFTFNSPTSMERHAAIVIDSSDPDTPRVRIPIVVTVP